jgi:hypothetical protein
VIQKEVELFYVVTIAMKEKNASQCYMAIGAKQHNCYERIDYATSESWQVVFYW